MRTLQTMVNRITHIIWDWNGTLFDDAWLCVEITNQLLQRRGLQSLTRERYQALFDFPVRRYYERLGFNLQVESFESLGSEFILAYEQRRLECRLQPGAREVIEQVSRAGLTQSILSAYRHERLAETVRHYGLTPFFADMIGIEDDYAGGKTEQGRRWMVRAGHRPETSMLIGDTVHDFEVAAALGTACVLIPSGHHPRSKLEALGAEVLDSILQVPRRLGSL